MELKFRAYCPVEKKMFYRVNINDGKAVKYGYQWFNESNTIYNSGVMQYTGLKSKTGVEIFEGDIIKAVIIEYDSLITMGVVTYDPEHAFYANKNEGGLTPLYKLGYIEIVGNIHDDPEILKK